MIIERLKTSVTSAEFVRHFGMWQDRAATRPVFVTHHGRERLVVLSVPIYEQLNQRAAHGDRALAEPAVVRLGSVLDRLVQGFIAVDRHLVITEINGAAVSYLRLDRPSAVGVGLADRFPGFGETPLHSHLVRAARSGEAAVFDQASLAFESRWLRFETMPYLDGAAMVFRDVTEERAQCDQAEEQAALAVATAAHGGIGRARISPRGMITMIDRPLALMAGLEPDVLIGARLADMLPLGRRLDAVDRIEAVLSGAGPASFTTALKVHRDGELPVRISLAEIRGERPGGGATVLVTAE